MINANLSNKTRKEVYRRDGYGCALCDCTRTLQIHHHIPRSKGGSNSPENLITLCMYCHALAHGTDLNETGMTAEDAEQAIIEYLADYYAPGWIEEGFEDWYEWLLENPQLEP